MTNFKIVARPTARIRSIAAWDRLRGTYDMRVLSTDPDNYWKMNELFTSESLSYNGIILSDGPDNFWTLDNLVLSIGASYDVVVIGDSPDNYWKLND